MWPESVCTVTMMSSIVSTVRSAVLKGVFSGTRSMPKRISVIFMSFSCSLSAANSNNRSDAVDERLALPEQQRRERRHGYAVHRHLLQSARAVPIGDARGVVNHVRHAVIISDHHHHVAGNIDEIASAQIMQHREPM